MFSLITSQYKWYILTMALILVVGGGIDVTLVLTGYRSISLTVWLVEQAHPTIIAGIAILGLWLGYMTKDYYWLSALLLILTGHFITSEGAAIALTSVKQTLVG